MNERIKELRKELNLTLEKFGERIGVSRSAMSNIENGNRGVTDQMFKSICREFNVNEEAFRTGEGWPEHMFRELPEEDEDAALVYDLLMDKNNPFFYSILTLVKTYKQLAPANQEVLCAYCSDFIKNLSDTGNKLGG